MPKIGMEPIRRDALVKATIAEVGGAGSLDVTVSQIARRAGMSSALAHHYFGGKDQIFLAAMRRILSDFGAEARRELAAAAPYERASAIVRACFAPSCFAPDVIAAWMTFYVLAQNNPQALRLWRIYQRRLRSNLTHALRGQSQVQGAWGLVAVLAVADQIKPSAAKTVENLHRRGLKVALITGDRQAAALLSGLLDLVHRDHPEHDPVDHGERRIARGVPHRHRVVAGIPVHVRSVVGIGAGGGSRSSAASSVRIDARRVSIAAVQRSPRASSPSSRSRTWCTPLRWRASPPSRSHASRG